MTLKVELTDEMKKKIEDIKAGRPPQPTKEPITTLTPPRKK